MRKIFLGLALLFTITNVAAQTSTIVWSVENPYPLIKSPELVKELSPNRGEAPSDWYSRIAATGQFKWPRTEGTQWDEANENFYPEYLSPALTHDIVVKLENHIPTGVCTWSVGQSRRASSCAESTILQLPYPDGAVISVVLPDGTQIASTDIAKVEDILILGLGDSYASGEGNPDQPASYRNPTGKEWDRLVDKGPSWITEGIALIAPAEWLDYRCHRSMYGYQNMAAMWLAAQAHNRVVRFVPLSCSGAVTSEMYQRGQKSLAETRFGAKPTALKQAQIDAAKSALTSGTTYRKPDIILMSIGGNDGLFGGTITQMLMPAKGTNPISTVAQKLFRKTLGISANSANGRLVIKNELEGRYLTTFTALRKRLDLGPETQLLWSSYPDPLEREDGVACSIESKDNCASEYHSGKDKLCRNSAFQVLKLMDGPFTFLKQPGIVSFEINDVRTNFVEPMQRRVRDSAADIKGRWQKLGGPELVFIDAPEHLGKRHGICAVQIENASQPENELQWPVPNKDGGWKGISPAEYQPYAPSNRWFRSSNDASLIQNRNQAGLSGWGSRIRGTFHPTAEYHSHVADAVVCGFRAQWRGELNFCDRTRTDAGGPP